MITDDGVRLPLRRMLLAVSALVITGLIVGCGSPQYDCPPLQGYHADPASGARSVAAVDPCDASAGVDKILTVYSLSADRAKPAVATAIQRRFTAADVKGWPLSVPLRCGAATGAPSDWGLRHFRWAEAHGDPWHRDPFTHPTFDAEIIRTLGESTAQVQGQGNTLLVVARYTQQKSSCFSNNPWGFAVVIGLNDRGFGDQRLIGMITAYWIDPTGNMAPPMWWIPTSDKTMRSGVAGHQLF